VTTTYFGPRWDAPLLDDPDDGSPAPVQVATPVGEPCYVCSESIRDGERGLQRLGYGNAGVQTPHVHTECEMLGVIGHAYGVCRCTGWDTTSRTAALELLRVIDGQRAADGRGPL
jgi:hypothetical protein